MRLDHFCTESHPSTSMASSPFVGVNNQMSRQLVLGNEAFSALRAEVVQLVLRRNSRPGTRLMMPRQPLYACERQ